MKIWLTLNDLTKMRSVILRELKDVRRFFDMMEQGVKSRNPLRIRRAYMFLQVLVYHMDKGELTPESIELADLLQQSYEESKEPGVCS